MLIQIIFALVESFIQACFLFKIFSFEKKHLFIVVCTMSSVLLTETYNQYKEVSILFLFIYTFMITAIVFLFKKRLYIYDYLIVLISSIFLIVANFCALLILSLLMGWNIVGLVDTVFPLIVGCTISKVIYALMCIVFYRFKDLFSLNEKHNRWWIVVPIFLSILLNSYLIGYVILNDAIVTNSILIALWNTAFLCFLVIVLCFVINKEAASLISMDITKQRQEYITENKKILTRMYHELSTLEHQNTYHYMQLKFLMMDHQYDKAIDLLDCKIMKLEKYQNIVQTGDIYLDYMLNVEINKKRMEEYDFKVICSKPSYDIQLDKEQTDSIINIFHYLLPCCQIDKPFMFETKITSNYFIVNYVFSLHHSIDKKSIESYLTKDIVFNLITIDSLVKVILMVKCHK